MKTRRKMDNSATSAAGDEQLPSRLNQKKGCDEVYWSSVGSYQALFSSTSVATVQKCKSVPFLIWKETCRLRSKQGGSGSGVEYRFSDFSLPFIGHRSSCGISTYNASNRTSRTQCGLLSKEKKDIYNCYDSSSSLMHHATSAICPKSQHP